MAQKKRRAKNEPTQGDLLAQQYRNRAAMLRVYEAALDKRFGNTHPTYWVPLDIRTLGM